MAIAVVRSCAEDFGKDALGRRSAADLDEAVVLCRVVVQPAEAHLFVGRQAALENIRMESLT